jgi:hypothetical protein
MSSLQFDIFGPPEDVESTESRNGRLRDDAPAPWERENLWPAELVDLLGVEALEHLYGDVTRRTRITKAEVCRRGRIQHTQFYDLVNQGSLDAGDWRSPDSSQPYLRIYRYSLILFMFNREFVFAQTRCNLPAALLNKCLKAAETLRARKRVGAAA